jgi:hypothetical protein
MMRTILLASLGGGLLFAQSSAPEIPYDAADLLKLPEHIYMGEAAGVATNSKGRIFVYTRTGDPYATTGTSRTFVHGGSRLFEFDATGKFVREIGQGIYGFLFAQAVRIDPQDNIWVVDRGSSQVIKFDPDGRVAMLMGRKPEAVFVGGRGEGGRGGGGGGRGPAGPPGAGSPGDLFNQPTDVTWDAEGNIFVADGLGNSRIAKFDKNGRFLKTWGSKGSEPGQFDMLQSLATDAQGNLYAADRGNKRIQVFNSNGDAKMQISNIGAPWAICISPGSHPYLYSSNSNETNSMDNGEVYKLELDGRVVGKFGRAGKLAKEFGTVNQMDCRRPNEIFVAEITNWRVQKLSLRPN